MSEDKSKKHEPKYLGEMSVVKKGASHLVTIPSEYVKKYGLKPKDKVSVFEYGQCLLIVPTPVKELIQISLDKYLPPTS